jgi:hypothetical protein
MMSNEQPDYMSYLLRLWRETAQGQTVWWASLESSLTSERQVFTSLCDLFQFLRQQTGAALGNKDTDETKV